MVRSFMTVMFRYPEFPKLMLKEIQGDGLCQAFLLDTVKHISMPLFDKVTQQLQLKGKIRPDVNLALLRISVISLMVFPMFNFHVMEHIDGVRFSEDFLEQLIMHNLNLIQYGSFNHAD